MNDNIVAWIGVGLILANLFMRQWGLLESVFGNASQTSAKPQGGLGAKEGYAPTSALYYMNANSPLGARILG